MLNKHKKIKTDKVVFFIPFNYIILSCKINVSKILAALLSRSQVEHQVNCLLDCDSS